MLGGRVVEQYLEKYLQQDNLIAAETRTDIASLTESASLSSFEFIFSSSSRDLATLTPLLTGLLLCVGASLNF